MAVGQQWNGSEVAKGKKRGDDGMAMGQQWSRSGMAKGQRWDGSRMG